MSTIYDMDGDIIAEGVSSQAVCDETIQTACRIARRLNRSVVVEDHGTHQCYRVTPGGHIWRAPSWWKAPEWGDE